MPRQLTPDEQAQLEHLKSQLTTYQRNLRNPLLLLPRGVAELTGAVRGVGAKAVPEVWRRPQPKRVVR